MTEGLQEYLEDERSEWRRDYEESQRRYEEDLNNGLEFEE